MHINSDVVNGTRFRYYSNEIVLHSGENDPDLTNKMREDEQSTVHMTAAMERATLTQQYGEREFVPHYISTIQQRLCDTLVTARGLVSDNADSATIHFHRRIIAFYHQEMELWGQGHDIWLAAIEDRAHMIFGRGYDLFITFLML